MTLDLDLDLQSQESHGHYPYTGKRSLSSKVRVETDRQTDRRTDGRTEAIALPAVLTGSRSQSTDSSRTRRRAALTSSGRWYLPTGLVVDELFNLAEKSLPIFLCMQNSADHVAFQKCFSYYCALEVDNFMRYINLLTYLLTYLL